MLPGIGFYFASGPLLFHIYSGLGPAVRKTERKVRVAILQAVKELASKTPQTYFRHTARATAAPAASTARAQGQLSQVY